MLKHFILQTHSSQSNFNFNVSNCQISPSVITRAGRLMMMIMMMIIIIIMIIIVVVVVFAVTFINIII